MSQLVGLVVYAPKGRRKRDDEDVPIKKIGKVRNVVCSPSGKRVVGLIVHQRDIAGMIAQPDLFVAYDAFEPYDKGIVISRPDDGVDNAARARLGLDWDSCIIWNGMDAKTEDDRQLGYVADIEFSAKTGKVRYFHLGDGNMSESLVGHVAVPGSMLIGYQDGWMIVDPEAAHLELSGGAAAKAGEGYARAKEGVSKATKKAGKVVGDAVDKGSRKVGKALGKAKRAVGKDPGKKAKEHMKGVTSMFGEFAAEFKKASTASSPSLQMRKEKPRRCEPAGLCCCAGLEPRT